MNLSILRQILISNDSEKKKKRFFFLVKYLAPARLVYLYTKWPRNSLVFPSLGNNCHWYMVKLTSFELCKNNDCNLGFTKRNSSEPLFLVCSRGIEWQHCQKWVKALSWEINRISSIAVFIWFDVCTLLYFSLFLMQLCCQRY